MRVLNTRIGGQYGIFRLLEELAASFVTSQKEATICYLISNFPCSCCLNGIVKLLRSERSSPLKKMISARLRLRVT